ncbi:thioredoxin domain-containing protein [Neptuniibacter sp. QD72_48]|uniref:thioredoxin domain-containing protein n=1 Tax=Neptuniibacter sp. QD72_48 TaxID=3398214 RepID=UPI0039F62C82
MAKKRKSGKTSTQKKMNPVKRKLNWKRVIRRGLFVSTIFGILAIAITVFSQQKQLEYDLSVIGNGKPTVVQIHDPNCSLCRQLKNNVHSVLPDFASTVQFKTANIASKKGREFALQHNVPHVSLLFFSRSGKRVHFEQGVASPERIRDLLQGLAKGKNISRIR